MSCSPGTRRGIYTLAHIETNCVLGNAPLPKIALPVWRVGMDLVVALPDSLVDEHPQVSDICREWGDLSRPRLYMSFEALSVDGGETPRAGCREIDIVSWSCSSCRDSPRRLATPEELCAQAMRALRSADSRNKPTIN